MLQSWLLTARKQKRVRTPSLGDRELAVLDILWRQAPRTAQEVQGGMPDPTISLSTIQSTLERLHRKDVLSRQKRARAFYYAPKVDRHELISSLLRDIAADIAHGDLAPMVSGFMDFLGSDSAAVAAFRSSDTASDSELEDTGRGDSSVAPDAVRLPGRT